MPDDVKISEMSEAASLDNSAQFPYVQSMNGNLTTLKAPLSQIGTKINEGMTFSNLQTTSKTIVGAINEAAQGGGVDYATELPISSTDPTDTKSYIDTKTTLVKSASGSLIHISDGGDNIPMKSLESEIVAVESGSGEKSPTNPYTISGFDSGVVSVCGVNLWDEQWELGSYDNTGNKVSYSTRIRSVNKFRVQPNTTYYFHCSASNRICFYDSDMVFVRVVFDVINTTFTTPNNAYYMAFNLADVYGTTYNNDVSVNYPSSDTQYHAYNGNAYTFTFGQTVYGGHFDNKGNLVVTHKMLDLGSVSYTYSSGDKWFYNASAISNEVLKPDTNDDIADIISEMYPSYSRNTLSGNDTLEGVAVNRTGTLQIRNLSYTDPATFKTAMSGVKLVYALATPITLAITSQDIPTLSGENNIFSNCGATDIEYFTSSADEVAELIRKQPMPLHHYSLGEVEIGTWIDGSTIYEKTIDIAQYSVTAEDTHFTDLVAIANIDFLVSAEIHKLPPNVGQLLRFNVSNDYIQVASITTINLSAFGNLPVTFRYTKSV